MLGRAVAATALTSLVGGGHMAEPAATSGDSSTAGTVTGIEPPDDEQGIEAIEELLKTTRFGWLRSSRLWP
jgi:hypothetical protein